MRNQFIAQFVVLSLQWSTCGTAHLDGRALFCAPISLQMITKCELCVLSGWNLAWKGSKSGSFEMSCHQMDCSAISWKFTNLSNDPRIFETTNIYLIHIICMYCNRARERWHNFIAYSLISSDLKTFSIRKRNISIAR